MVIKVSVRLMQQDSTTALGNNVT